MGMSFNCTLHNSPVGSGRTTASLADMEKKREMVLNNLAQCLLEITKRSEEDRLLVCMWYISNQFYFLLPFRDASQVLLSDSKIGFAHHE